MTKYHNNTVTSLSLTLGNVSISKICKLVSYTNMVNMLIYQLHICMLALSL